MIESQNKQQASSTKAEDFQVKASEATNSSGQQEQKKTFKEVDLKFGKLAESH